MTATLFVHILAGAIGLAAGFAALSVAKGSRLHRKIGILFVFAMLALGISGAAIAALTGVKTSVLMGLLTAYLSWTALTTVRTRAPASRRVDAGVMVLAFLLGLFALALGVQSLARGEGAREGMPLPMLFAFGILALSAGAGDLRILRGGELRGARRLARHLWRMCVALFIASGSFFLGQADEIPEPLRIPALLAVPAFLPLVAMAYWLWRVRFRGSRPVAPGERPERPALTT